ncbi:Uncharacterised protein [Mycobacterium tuberculosis]|nr:Uncharacterised protein [Mycobacterium tuberculosis]COW29206.1 Uncharacterised protein [Mycobacterium tuberculosis]COW71666.1 Uncharacterised protein [Mycobacterium tuberculosis]COW89030.1 Uncharacterised protein [Mycobacterium tuberculosis]COX36889.1 Uncharacterised protein [Mycobacterium tuberculosis]
MIPSVANRFGASRPKKTNPLPADARSFNLRDAVMPISNRNRQSTPWNAATKKLSSSCRTFCPCSPLIRPMTMPPKRRTSPGLRKTSCSNSREKIDAFVPLSLTPSSSQFGCSRFSSESSNSSSMPRSAWAVRLSL